MNLNNINNFKPHLFDFPPSCLMNVFGNLTHSNKQIASLACKQFHFYSVISDISLKYMKEEKKFKSEVATTINKSLFFFKIGLESFRNYSEQDSLQNGLDFNLSACLDVKKQDLDTVANFLKLGAIVDFENLCKAVQKGDEKLVALLLSSIRFNDLKDHGGLIFKWQLDNDKTLEIVHTDSIFNNIKSYCVTPEIAGMVFRKFEAALNETFDDDCSDTELDTDSDCVEVYCEEDPNTTQWDPDITTLDSKDDEEWEDFLLLEDLLNTTTQDLNETLQDFDVTKLDETYRDWDFDITALDDETLLRSFLIPEDPLNTTIQDDLNSTLLDPTDRHDEYKSEHSTSESPDEMDIDLDISFISKEGDSEYDTEDDADFPDFDNPLNTSF